MVSQLDAGANFVMRTIPQKCLSRYLRHGPTDTESGLSGAQWLQQAIWEQHRVRTVRCTLAQIAEQGSLDASGQLKVDDSVVAVAYFRAGYSPNDYPTDVEWKARCDSTTPLHDP